MEKLSQTPGLKQVLKKDNLLLINSTKTTAPAWWFVLRTYPYNMKQFIFVITLIFFATSFVQAQNEDSTQLTKTQFKISFNYNSRLNYYGRTDSLKSNGVFPLAELWVTQNFYLNAAPIFVNNKVQSFEYAGTVATAGYQHLSEKWLTNLYVLKPFYKEDSKLVQSALKAQTGLTVARLNKILNITVGADAKFSDKTDFGATAGFDHIIRIQNKNNSVLVFDPSFYASAGTQNFSNTYTKKKNNGLILPGNDQQITESKTEFNILSYEFLIPVIYAKGKWMFIITPSYILPQNLVVVPNRPDLSETGENMFYTTAGIKYSF